MSISTTWPAGNLTGTGCIKPMAQPRALTATLRRLVPELPCATSTSEWSSGDGRGPQVSKDMGMSCPTLEDAPWAAFCCDRDSWGPSHPCWLLRLAEDFTFHLRTFKRGMPGTEARTFCCMPSRCSGTEPHPILKCDLGTPGWTRTLQQAGRDWSSAALWSCQACCSMHQLQSNF